MKPLRSDRSTQGREMAGARALWRANGMKESHFGKPIIAIVNSFTQFVPGHVHLHNVGQRVKAIIEEMGFFAAEFNTIAIDDGIAMGHSGMLYSLPSREIIADSIEYMCNAHCVDAMICISNCDKITPGMLMAAVRLNIPTVMVSGGPMEAGRVGDQKYDLVDVMVKGADSTTTAANLEEIEKAACPTCGSCSGMFTANSMNCLTEAIGIAPVGNGTLLATHKKREELIERAAKMVVELTKEYYFNDNEATLPRSIVTRDSLFNAMALDIAMGGSTNTVLHLLAVAHEAEVPFTMEDIDATSKRVPELCKVSPNSHYHIEDVHRAGGVMRILGELNRGGFIESSTPRVDWPTLKDALTQNDIATINQSLTAKESLKVQEFYLATSGGRRSLSMGSQMALNSELDLDSKQGCIRDISHAYSNDGGLAVLYGNIATAGSIVKSAGVPDNLLQFKGNAVVFESQEEAVAAILNGVVVKGDVVVIRYEGPAGGPGMQEMLYPTSYLKSMDLANHCALITDGRFSGGSSGLSIGHISPEAAAGGAIALIESGDTISIDIPNRKLNLDLTEGEIERRRERFLNKNRGVYTPKKRLREISKALKFYSQSVSSADQGAVRIIK